MNYLTISERGVSVNFSAIPAELTPDQAKQVLIDILRQAGCRSGVFCNSNVGTVNRTTGQMEPLPEAEWTFFWKDPSTCGRCLPAQQLMRRLFGKEWDRQPFVKYEGSRQYRLVFRTLLGLPELPLDPIERAIAQIIDRKLETHKCKLPMETGRGPVEYDRPMIVDRREFRGNALVIVREQIDHHVGGDKQLRQELYEIQGNGTVKLIMEDHAFQSEGEPQLKIISIGRQWATLQTRYGRRRQRISGSIWVKLQTSAHQ
jgi:hypothetical protein